MRRPVLALAFATSALVLAGCGGGGGSDAAEETTTTAATLPAECQGAPVTVDLRAEGARPAGAEAFEATEAVALRTPILPGELAFDSSSLAAAQDKAETTPLAAYSLYLADFEIDRAELTDASMGMVTPPPGGTLGVLSLVPSTEAGLAVGDVVTAGTPGYETNSSLQQLSLTVFADGDATGMPYTDVTGQAEVLALTDEQICVSFDVAFENAGELVYAGSGTVAAPVVRSGPAFFFT